MNQRLKLKLIEDLYTDNDLSQTEKPIMTYLILVSDDNRKCTIPLSKIARANNIARFTAWRLINNLITKNYVMRYDSIDHKKLCTYEIVV